MKRMTIVIGATVLGLGLAACSGSPAERPGREHSASADPAIGATTLGAVGATPLGSAVQAAAEDGSLGSSGTLVVATDGLGEAKGQAEEVLGNGGAVVIVGDDDRDVGKDMQELVGVNPGPTRGVVAAIQGPIQTNTFAAEMAGPDQVADLQEWAQDVASDRAAFAAQLDAGGEVDISPANIASNERLWPVDWRSARGAHRLWRDLTPPESQEKANWAKAQVSAITVWSCANDQYFTFVDADYTSNSLPRGRENLDWENVGTQRFEGKKWTYDRTAGKTWVQLVTAVKEGEYEHLTPDAQLWPGFPTGKASINEQTPAQSRYDSSFESGFEAGLTGDVGISKGEFQGKIVPSVKWSSKKTTTIPAVVVNQTLDNAHATVNWEYVVADPGDGSWQTGPAGFYWKHKDPVSTWPSVAFGSTNGDSLEHKPALEQPYEYEYDSGEIQGFGRTWGTLPLDPGEAPPAECK